MLNVYLVLTLFSGGEGVQVVGKYPTVEACIQKANQYAVAPHFRTKNDITDVGCYVSKYGLRFR